MSDPNAAGVKTPHLFCAGGQYHIVSKSSSRATETTVPEINLKKSTAVPRFA
jgi:hypothetical protein